jgi:hypothetical protein
VDVSAKLDYLLRTLRLPVAAARSMLLAHPVLFASVFAEEVRDNLGYLEGAAGLSKRDLRELLRRNPSVMRYRRPLLRRAVGWFRTRATPAGCSMLEQNERIRRVLARAPALLGYSLPVLDAKADYFESRLNMTRDDFADVVSAMPAVLT